MLSRIRTPDTGNYDTLAVCFKVHNSPAMEYWRVVRKEAWNRTKVGLASRQRLLTSICVPTVSAIIGVVILRILGSTISLTLGVGLVSALTGYGLMVLYEWSWHLIHLPAEMHSQDVREYQALATSHAELRRQIDTPPPSTRDPIMLRVQQGNWGTPRNARSPNEIEVSFHEIEVSFQIQIRNGGPPTTLDDWALRVKARKGLTCRLTGFSLGSPNAPSITDIRINPLSQGGASAGSIAFEVVGMPLSEAKEPSLGWFIEFSDASGTLHMVDIPPEHYSHLH